MRAPRKRRSLWLIPLVLLPPLSYYGVYRCPLPFVQSWWATEEWNDPYHRRHRIADGLLLSGLLVGRSRADVVELLGEPPPTSYFRDWQLVYNLGAERSWLSIDSEWLVLRVDRSNIVREARLVRD